MDTKDISRAQGHWILARMGKKVLRPGGKELTQKLIKGLDITPKDSVVEFAPGLGFTASLTLRGKPQSYVGIDEDEDAVKLLKKNLHGSNIKFIKGTASKTMLDDDSQDKVYGEAMLTMQADHRKTEIIKEAYRILRNDGLYAIHELGLVDVDENLKSEIQRDLALTIKVNARPLTKSEWVSLLEKEGFEIQSVFTNGMHLLEKKRILDDEGLFRTLKIACNILTHPKARKRIIEMRKIFRKHSNHINAIAIIAKKNYNHINN